MLRYMPNPAVQILIWVILTIALQLVKPALLLVLGLLLLAAALADSAARLRMLLHRTRWIMLSLLLIYAYATPGDALFAQLGSLSPVREGLLEGLQQLGRLLCALAALAILLSRLDQRQLIGGLYTLAYPLRYMGLSRERIAVRLALTLHYAEFAILETASDWRISIEHLLAPTEVRHDSIELQVVPLTPRDGLLLLAACASLVLVLL
jgi:energy-coupling factor transport system permease protein